MDNAKKKINIRILSVILTAVIFVTCMVAYFPGKQSISSFISSLGSSDDNFDVRLYWSSAPDTDGWHNVESSGYTVAFSGDVKWEPGHSEIRYFKVDNAGSVDFTYELDLDSPGDDYDNTDEISKVIDVYSTTDVADLSAAAYTYEGTLSEVMLDPQILTGDMAAGGSTSCALKLTMQTTAGNEYQGQKVGFKVKASAYAEEPDSEFSGTFGCVFPYYDSILYRVGNANTVKASSMFYINEEESSSESSLLMINAHAADTLDDSLVTFTSSVTAGSASVTITPDTTDWSAGTFKFSGTGVVNIKLLYNGAEKVSLNLEVMDGKNVTAASSATSSNIILLNDVTTASNISVSNGYTLYGNGFSVNDSRTVTSGTSGFLNMNNGTLDNVQILGQEYPETVTSGTTNSYYSPCVYVGIGGATINNSLVSGCKSAVRAEGNLYAENTTFAGGTVSNVTVLYDAVLTNCITSHSLNGGLKGLAVMVGSLSSHITLNGTFNQYNWVQSSELPSSYSTFLSSVYNDSTFAYTTGGKTYINPGIFFMSEGSEFTQALASAAITDNTGNNYGSVTKSFSSTTATAYIPKASMASSDTLSLSSYSMIDQYPTMPDAVFDYTTLNYIEKTADSNKYCYYDSASESVLVSFESDEGSFSWNPMILSLSKYGSSVPYTVSMNGTDYTDGTISFISSGDYEVVYTYTDTDYYHGRDAEKSSVTYTKSVKISVTVITPETVVYHPQFTYPSGSSTKKVIIDNNTYIMPDVSATSSTIGSKTISGQTVYYPIVTVNGASATGGSYSSGGIYYFAPAFSAINITDYNQSTGKSQYTYNTSSTTWPHGRSKPDTSVYNYDTSGTHPYEPSSGTSSQGHTYISGSGLCFSTSNIDQRNGTAGNRVVKFYYVGNDGITYYYYICYAYTATTLVDSPTCLAEGTMITLADGTEKPIEEIKIGDEVLTWNFYRGRYDTRKVIFFVNHGESDYRVVNTTYSDGTVLRTIGEHDIFDYDLNRFIALTPDNCCDYIGHRFVRVGSDGMYDVVTMKSAEITDEKTSAYSITTSTDYDVFADGMLTSPPPGNFYNFVDMGDKLHYDMKTLIKDILKYGFYDYSAFSDYLTYKQFIAYNGPLLKIAVAKGKFSYDYIIELIKTFLQ